MAPDTRVVAAQPALDVWDYENHWQKNLSDCCESCPTCCFAHFCFFCYVGKLYKRTNECCCMFCVPGGMMSLRSKLRTGFRIRGSICKDFIATSFCPICAAIQMAAELDKQEL